MSQIPPASAHSPPIDPNPQNDRGSLERKRRLADDEGFSLTEGRESVRSRPLSWHPSAPVEPPLDSSQHRSIGVSSILNHPATDEPGPRTLSADSGREGLGDQSPESFSHSRFSSTASTVHLPSPSMHHEKPLVSSPGIRNHPGIAPVSPSARFVGTAGYFTPRVGAGQSPLAQQLPALQTVAPSSPLPMGTPPGHSLPLPGHHHQPFTHLTSTFANHHASTSQPPTPSSKEASPTTPVSVFSQLGRSSPAMTAAAAPQPTPFHMSSFPFTAADPLLRLPSAQRRPQDEAIMGVAHTDAPRPGMIYCAIDVKSGSRGQSDKRRANSDASRRFRHRKKEDAAISKKLAAKEEEMRKQTEAMQKQLEDLRMLEEQRDFYRSERDYFREQVSHFIPATSERDSWSGSDAPRKIEESASGSIAHQGTPVPAGAWSTVSSGYPTTQTERIVPDERQTRPMPPTPGSWKHSA
ncbi:hypothetical protein BJX99DRAFT_233764 [Aspergillus californicus]